AGDLDPDPLDPPRASPARGGSGGTCGRRARRTQPMTPQHPTADGPDRPDPAAREVGVGPHPLPWPDDPRLDPELLAGGDRRNVVDPHRYWNPEAAGSSLRSRRPLHLPAV